MTIRHPKAFEAMRPAGFDGTFEWEFLAECWSGTKIQPMDFDAVIERRGHYIGFETKSLGKDIPTGQRLAIEATLRTGRWIWFLVEGKCFDSIQKVTVCGPKMPQIERGHIIDPCGPNRLQREVRRAFVHINGSDPDPAATARIEWLAEYEKGMHEEEDDGPNP